MEDVFSVAYQQTPDETDLEYAFFGIFDGHGGKEAADYAKNHLMDNITKLQNFWSENDDLVLKSIREGFLQTQQEMQGDLENWSKTASGLPSTAGTTASIAFVRRGKIFVGHVGDSGIVLGEQDEDCPDIWAPRPLTRDHKPECEIELARIEGAGGKVVNKSGVPRVVWNRPRVGHTGPVRRSTHFDEVPFLAVARALGDLWSYNSKKDVYVVSPDPDLHVYTIDISKHRCLVLGTDGAWNVLSPAAAINAVKVAEKQNEKKLLEPEANIAWLNPSKKLVDLAVDRWKAYKLRADNTTCVVVMLDPPGPQRKEVISRQRELAEKGLTKETKKPCNNAGAPPLPPKPNNKQTHKGLSIISRFPNSKNPREAEGKNLVSATSGSSSPATCNRVVHDSSKDAPEKVRVSTINAKILPGTNTPKHKHTSQNNLQVNEVTSSDTETPEKASSSSTSTSVKPTARKSISRELAALALDSPAADTVSRSRRPTGGGGRATTKPRRRGRSIEGLGNDDSDTENNGGSSDVNAMVPAAKLVEVEKKCEQLTNQLKAMEEKVSKAMQSPAKEARSTRAAHKEEKGEKSKKPETPRILRSRNGNVDTPESGTKRKLATAESAVPVKRERTVTWTGGNAKSGTREIKAATRPARRSTGTAASTSHSVGKLRRVKLTLKRK